MNSTNDKIVIRLELPISGIAHDVKLPQDLKIRDVVPTLVSMLGQMHEDGLLLSDQRLLCRSTGEPLTDPNATLKECDVRDTDILYLV